MELPFKKYVIREFVKCCFEVYSKVYEMIFLVPIAVIIAAREDYKQEE